MDGHRSLFLAGASGVIGAALLPLLIESGYRVTGMTRSERGAEALRAAGAEAVICDVFDAEQLREVVVAAKPEIVMHQLTDLPDDPGQIGEHGPRNDRIRTEGTTNLLAAARAASARRILVQSIAWEIPLERRGVIEAHEAATLAAGGVVLRYGRFYGPGTWSDGGELPDPPRVSVAEAARRTLAAIDAPSGVLVISEA
jgi:nucleoside-diphosphate-sugar epimerase